MKCEERDEFRVYRRDHTGEVQEWQCGMHRRTRSPKTQARKLSAYVRKTNERQY